MRPANIVTAFADILAGFAIAGGMILWEGFAPLFTPAGLGWLLISTIGLYGGGVVFNDVFDAPLDAEERPERPIPSNRATLKGATLLGTLLLAGGVYSAFQVGPHSGVLAFSIAFLALIYDARAKHSSLWGPLNMGLCRGGNLLLGCSIVPSLLFQYWFLAIIPVIYIGSITLVSRGEVHGGSKRTGLFALLLILMVSAALFLLGILSEYNITSALPFILVFMLTVIPSFAKAAFEPQPPIIKKAVKRGVLSLIILNSAIVAGFGGIIIGVVTLLLLPISIGLSRLFAVT